MARCFALGFVYDIADRAEDDFLRNRTVGAIRNDNLAPARRKLHQLRLYFMNPNLLICPSLPIQFRISEIERLAGSQHDQGKISQFYDRPCLGIAFRQNNAGRGISDKRLWLSS